MCHMREISWRSNVMRYRCAPSAAVAFFVAASSLPQPVFAMTTIANTLALFAEQPDAAVKVVEAHLARATDLSGEGARVFLSLNEKKIREQASESKSRFETNTQRALEGIAISIKDLFDVKDEVTSAGSTVLRSRVAASEDAPAVARLRNAGAIPFGRTNMTEFAFSGVGLNPHYGTPRNVWGRNADGSGRIPGGSSSGAGVSVADGMCIAGLGTDTGGSVRVPAALNGVVGFKPSAYRVPVLGSIPLSVAHDSIGPLANCVDDCARIDAVLSGQAYSTHALDLRGVKLLKPQSIIWQDLDPEVERATLAAIERLKSAGAMIVEAPLDPLDEVLRMVNPGVSALALDWHDEHIKLDGVGYDPRVWKRMQLGREVTRQRQSQATAGRRFWIDKMNMQLANYDALICPTVACIAPEIEPLVVDDEAFFTANLRILRNTGWVNALDGCAITLPCHVASEAPVGLQIVCAHARDAHLLALARSIEQILEHRNA
jgi:aspartyl-tRNA(Asn)/glutamyl-tRNA(Gln) amidotransferase subunit A